MPRSKALLFSGSVSVLAGIALAQEATQATAVIGTGVENRGRTGSWRLAVRTPAGQLLQERSFTVDDRPRLGALRRECVRALAGAQGLRSWPGRYRRGYWAGRAPG